MFHARRLGWYVLVVLYGCGAGEAVRPKDPTYAGAVGGPTIGDGASCHDVNAENTPLIVDWKQEQRADLEVAMRKGVAVVHYDCNSFKILTDCHPPGKYEFVGVTKKEQIISLTSADEAKANLPFSGGSIGGGISTGTSLDIALEMIGKQSSPNAIFLRDELPPPPANVCDGATHIVRSATVGAFAMKTGTAGQVKTAASLFGVGADASSASSKSVANKDGDTESCNGADPDAPTPPKGCRAALRIQLLPIVDGAKQPDSVAKQTKEETGKKNDKPPEPKPPADISCPEGLVASQGKCTVATANVAHECKYGDAKDCDAQCNAGDLASCAKLGFMHSDMEGHARYDETKALALFQKACSGGNDAGCSGLGGAYEDGEGVPENVVKAAQLYLQSCRGGYADACDNLGDLFDRGAGVPNDRQKGFALHVRACNMASSQACTTLGEMYEKGKDVPKNLATAIGYYGMACDAGEAANCGDLGDRYMTGEGGFQIDKPMGTRFYLRACNLGYSSSCGELAKAYETGSGVAKDPRQGDLLLPESVQVEREVAVL